MSFIDCVVSNVAIATVLAVIAFFLGRVATKPQVTHTLWVLVLVKLVTPPLVHIPVTYTVSRPKPISSTSYDGTTIATREPSAIGGSIEHEAVGTTDVAPLDAHAHEVAGANSSFGSAPAVPWMHVLAGVWITGSLVWYLVAATRLMRFRKVLRYAAPAPADILAEVRTIASRYRLCRIPRVLVVDAKVPPLIGVFGRRPTLVLPGGLLSQLEEDGRTGLLAHELAHVKRYDHWLRWFEFSVLAIYWWNPVAWWARSQVQRAEEECCDGWVLWAFPEKSRLYAQTLVDTVEFLARSSESKPVMATAFSQGKSLKRRIEMIVNNQGNRVLSWKLRGVLILWVSIVAPLSLVARGGGGHEDLVTQDAGAVSGETSKISTHALDSKRQQSRPLAKGTVAEVVEAWNARQKSFPCGVVKWTEKRFVAKGGIAQPGRLDGYGNGNNAPIPGDDTTHSATGQFAFKGDMGRYSGCEPLWSSQLGRFTEFKHDIAFDGEALTTLHSLGEPTGPVRDEGWIGGRPEKVLGNWSVLPIRTFFRPPTGAKNNPLQLTRLSPSNQVARIDGLECWSLKNGSIRIWLTGRPDLLLMRMERLASGVPVITLDISYDTKTKFPRKWVSLQRTVDGKLTRRTIGTVDSIDLNTDLARDDFRIKFPRHTFVTDRTGARPGSYILQDEGRKTPTEIQSLSTLSKEDYTAIRDGQSPAK